MIIAYFIVFFTFICHIPQVSRIFLCVFRVIRGFMLSLLRVSIPHKPAVGSGGGCSLSSRTADEPKNKMQNTLDYENMFPPMESNHRLSRSERGMG